ncbi:ATP-binding protein, partial [Pantanalinema rosaneae CENA516]|uniref:ATP-binding protein n=1 Tax=Pantanalinema rosaneae TaxID=1620701 RepID=UPI003D6E5285
MSAPLFEGGPYTSPPNVDIAPSVGILGVFSHLNYEPWFALAEYIDNALQSALSSMEELKRLNPNYSLTVDIEYEREQGGRIVIEDNAAGIARSDFGRAFKAAEVPPDRSGLSEFGMGMKSASIWFARNWRVVTSSPGDPATYSVEFDMETVLSDRLQKLEVREAEAPAGLHFTRVELWNLNQFLNGRTLGKVREHLREIYRAYLKSGQLRLTVAGLELENELPEILRAVDYRANDVAGISEEVVQWRKDISFLLGNDVVITGWAALRAEGRTNGNGLSLFRRGRVIVGTTGAPYRPQLIYGQSNSYRSQRLFGDLTIEGLPVSHTKDGFQWNGREEEFEEALRRELNAEPLPLLKQAENYRARFASRAEKKRIERAGHNTAEVSKRKLPGALEGAASQDERRDSGDLGEAPPENAGVTREFDFSRDFSFEHGRFTWLVTIAAVSRPA